MIVRKSLNFLSLDFLYVKTGEIINILQISYDD